MNSVVEGGDSPKKSVGAAETGNEARESMRTPKVSVVIPAYNSASMVKEAIESVLKQTYRDFEIVVVDDGSTDDTEPVVRGFGDQVVYVKQKNQGAGAARNSGITKSRGEYIAFLDSDDLWSAGKLDEQVPVLEQDPELGLVYCDWAIVSDGKVVEESYLRKLPATSGRIFDDLIQCGFILTSGVVARRSCLEDVGDFDNSLSIAQDYDLWLRISYRWKIAIVNKPLLTKRNWDGSLSSNLSKTAAERITLYEKALKAFKDLPPRSRRLLERQLALNHWDVGYHYFDQFLFKEARKEFLASLRHSWTSAKVLGYLAASYLPRPLAKAMRGIKWAIS